MSIFLAVLLQTAPWTAGEEREVASGVFATLFYEQARWRIWKSENGGTPKCVLAQAGVSDEVIPLGLHPHVLSREARLEIWNGGSYWKMNGLGGDARMSYRKEGEKFFTERFSVEWFKFKESERIEVRWLAWEYPALRRGIIDQTVSLDMTGLSEGLAALKLCEKSKKSQ